MRLAQAALVLSFTSLSLAAPAPANTSPLEEPNLSVTGTCIELAPSLLLSGPTMAPELSSYYSSSRLALHPTASRSTTTSPVISTPTPTSWEHNPSTLCSSNIEYPATRSLPNPILQSQFASFMSADASWREQPAVQSEGHRVAMSCAAENSSGFAGAVLTRIATDFDSCMTGLNVMLGSLTLTAVDVMPTTTTSPSTATEAVYQQRSY